MFDDQGNRIFTGEHALLEKAFETDGKYKVPKLQQSKNQQENSDFITKLQNQPPPMAIKQTLVVPKKHALPKPSKKTLIQKYSDWVSCDVSF